MTVVIDGGGAAMSAEAIAPPADRTVSLCLHNSSFGTESVEAHVSSNSADPSGKHRVPGSIHILGATRWYP